MTNPVAGKRPASPRETGTPTPPTTRPATVAARAALTVANSSLLPSGLRPSVNLSATPLPSASATSAAALPILLPSDNSSEESPQALTARLHAAIKARRTKDACKLILRLGPDQLNMPDAQGNTALGLAIRYPNREIAEGLIEAQRPNPDGIFIEPDPLPHVLGKIFPIDIVEIVGEYAGGLQRYETYLQEPLSEVPEEMVKATLQALLSPDTDPAPFRAATCWLRDWRGEKILEFSKELTPLERKTLLISAVRMHLPEFARVLLASKQEIDFKGNSMNEVLLEAIEHQDFITEQSLRKMIPKQSDPSSVRLFQLQMAARKGYLWAVKRLCIEVSDWKSAIEAAAEYQHLPIVQWLLENCPPEYAQEYFEAALHHCTARVDSEMQGKPIFDWLVNTFREGRHVTDDVVKTLVKVSGPTNNFHMLKWVFESLRSRVKEEYLIEGFQDTFPETNDDPEVIDLATDAATLSMLYNALSAEKKKEMALAAWKLALELYEDPAAWDASGQMLVNISWLLHCEHITDDLLRETLFSAVNNDKCNRVISLLICGRGDAFNGDIVGTALQLAAILKKWEVVAAIEAPSTGWYEAIPESYKVVTNSLKPLVANAVEEPDEDL